jgi:hypothetical protein
MLMSPTTFIIIVACGIPHEAPTLLTAARLIIMSGLMPARQIRQCQKSKPCSYFSTCTIIKIGGHYARQ